jgi:hypothetical protein
VIKGLERTVGVSTKAPIPGPASNTTRRRIFPIHPTTTAGELREGRARGSAGAWRAISGAGPAISWRREGGAGKDGAAPWPEEGDALAAGELPVCMWRACSGRRSQPAQGISGPGPASSGQRGGEGGELGAGRTWTLPSAPEPGGEEGGEEGGEGGTSAITGGKAGREGMGEMESGRLVNAW